MTCIAARRKPLEMGGDSAVSEEERIVYTKEPKIWAVADGFIGEAGDCLWREALRGIRWPAKLSVEFMRDHLPKIIRHRCQQIDDEIDGECLIAAPCGLWVFETDGAMLELRDPYAAIGSGADFALGALHTGASISKALKAAACHGQGVRPPFTILRAPAKSKAA